MDFIKTDTLPKFLITMGIIILVLSFVYSPSDKEHKRLTTELESTRKKISEETTFTSQLLGYLANGLQISNNNGSSDPSINPKETASGVIDDVRAAFRLDSLKRKGKFLSLDSLNARIPKIAEELEIADSELQLDKKLSRAGYIIGGIMIITGLVSWILREAFELNLLKRQNLSVPTFSNNCQSCGKGFNSIVLYGSDADNSPNYHFCKSCYNRGTFNDADFNQLKARIQNELAQSNVEQTTAKNIIRSMKSLERWKSHHFNNIKS